MFPQLLNYSEKENLYTVSIENTGSSSVARHASTIGVRQDVDTCISHSNNCCPVFAKPLRT